MSRPTAARRRHHRSGLQPGCCAPESDVWVYDRRKGRGKRVRKARYDVYRYDRATETTELVSVDAAGTGPGDGSSRSPDISADGSRISFQSAATDLVAGDSNGLADVFVRDLDSGTTELVSVADGGAPEGADGPSEPVSTLSADGRFVGFSAAAGNLVAGGAGGGTQVYRRGLDLGSTDLVSSSPAGEPADRPAGDPARSGDGRFPAFSSAADNLVRAPTKRRAIFLGDLGR